MRKEKGKREKRVKFLLFLTHTTSIAYITVASTYKKSSLLKKSASLPNKQSVGVLLCCSLSRRFSLSNTFQEDIYIKVHVKGEHYDDGGLLKKEREKRALISLSLSLLRLKNDGNNDNNTIIIVDDDVVVGAFNNTTKER